MGLPSKRAALRDEISKLSANLDQDRKKLKKLQAELKVLYDKNDIGNIALNTAICFIALDETDQALTWLERSLEKRDPLLATINSTRDFEVLHQEPRFKSLQTKMGLD